MREAHGLSVVHTALPTPCCLVLQIVLLPSIVGSVTIAASSPASLHVSEYQRFLSNVNWLL